MSAAIAPCSAATFSDWALIEDRWETVQIQVEIHAMAHALRGDVTPLHRRQLQTALTATVVAEMVPRMGLVMS